MDLHLGSIRKIGNRGDDGYKVEVVYELAASGGTNRSGPYKLVAELSKSQAATMGADSPDEAYPRLIESALKYVLSYADRRQGPPPVEHLVVKSTGDVLQQAPSSPETSRSRGKILRIVEGERP